MRSAPRRSSAGPADAARASVLALLSRVFTCRRWAATSRAPNATASPPARASVSSRTARSSAWSGLVAGSSRAAIRYHSSSWSCRTTENAANIRGAMSGSARQSAPANVSRETRCPAPKQS